MAIKNFGFATPHGYFEFQASNKSQARSMLVDALVKKSIIREDDVRYPDVRESGLRAEGKKYIASITWGNKEKGQTAHAFGSTEEEALANIGGRRIAK